MKAWVKAILGISLSLMCLFTCVGYASITKDLQIQGSIITSPPKELFITGVNGGSYVNPDTLAYTGTIVTSDVTLQRNASGEYYAEYEITVFNNTQDTYYYHAMKHGTYTTDEGEVVAYSNDNIVTEIDEATLKLNDAVEPGAQKTFKVKATLKDTSNTSNLSLHSIIEYVFGTEEIENSDEVAVAGVLEKFPEILNTAESYQELTVAMGSSSFIGNVVGADQDTDTKTINDLFGEAMKFNINGVDTPVTVMIKRKNIDGKTSTGDGEMSFFGNTYKLGYEMTLYITANPLTTAGSEATVYALVYTMDQTTKEWYQLGEVFTGTATVTDYDTGSSRGSGSFNTDTWETADGKSIEDLV